MEVDDNMTILSCLVHALSQLDEERGIATAKTQHILLAHLLACDRIESDTNGKED